MYPFSPSPSTHLLLPSSSYPWLPMVVSLFLIHLLLEVASPISFPPSPFHCHWSSRSKELHWWRRSKAYKLHIELHQGALKEGSFAIVTWAHNINHQVFLFFNLVCLDAHSQYWFWIELILVKINFEVMWFMFKYFHYKIKCGV